MYHGISDEICGRAWVIVDSGLLRAASSGAHPLFNVNKYAGTIVVLHPIEGGVLFTETIETNGKYEDAKYSRIAHAKAALTRRTGMSSREIQQRAPHLLQDGDVKWGGSVIRDGLVVAFSGVQAVYDEMIADWMASAIIAICRNEMTRDGGVMDADYSFIGGYD